MGETKRVYSVAPAEVTGNDEGTGESDMPVDPAPTDKPSSGGSAGSEGETVPRTFIPSDDGETNNGPSDPGSDSSWEVNVTIPMIDMDEIAGDEASISKEISVRGVAPLPLPLPDKLYCDEKVRKAMQSAWRRSGLGQRTTEAGFLTYRDKDGNIGTVKLPNTNAVGSIRFKPYKLMNWLNETGHFS